MSVYEEIQSKAVRRFLQTALVVDDHAVTAEAPDQSPELAASTTIDDDDSTTHEPAESSPGTDETADAAARIGEGADEAPDSPGNAAPGQVDVKRLADQFADEGISCAIMQPKGEPEAVERIVRAGALVDIIVLDWRMSDIDGEHAVEAITRLVARDGKDRRRLIAVYTTRRNLEDIASTILDALIDANHPAVDDGNLAMTVGGTRIVVLNKGGVTLHPKELQEHQVPQEELPARLVREFSRNAEGLVPSVALNALAAARENTQTILKHLSTDLDLGYAGHLLRIEHTEDGAGHLIDALADELRAVIQDDLPTREAAGTCGIEAWREHNKDRLSGSPEVLDDLFASNTADRDLMVALRKKHKQLSQIADTDLTSLLAPKGEKDNALRSDAQLAMLLSLRHVPNPMLQLGSIVYDERYERFWLCVQPVCDSVRLDGPTRFPLLRLEKLVDHVTKLQFHHVITAPELSGHPVRLWAASKPQDLHTVVVSPAPDGTARFTRGEDDRWRLNQHGGGDLIWVAQLKPAHAQRVAEDLGAELSRVGLDESEWLRKNSAGGKDRTPSDTWRPNEPVAPAPSTEPPPAEHS